MFKTELIIWKIPQGPICADAPQGLLARSRDCNGRLQDSRMDKASRGKKSGSLNPWGESI